MSNNHSDIDYILFKTFGVLAPSMFVEIVFNWIRDNYHFKLPDSPLDSFVIGINDISCEIVFTFNGVTIYTRNYTGVIDLLKSEYNNPKFFDEIKLTLDKLIKSVCIHCGVPVHPWGDCCNGCEQFVLVKCCEEHDHFVMGNHGGYDTTRTRNIRNQ